MYPEKENGHLNSIEAIVIVSIVTMNWSILSEQHKGQRPWPLTTWPETHMKHASTSLGLTTVAILVTIKETSDKILSWQHLRWRPAIWPWWQKLFVESLATWQQTGQTILSGQHLVYRSTGLQTDRPKSA